MNAQLALVERVPPVEVVHEVLSESSIDLPNEMHGR
jgi:hypothetical protein